MKILYFSDTDLGFSDDEIAKREVELKSVVEVKTKKQEKKYL